jgi:hypothetical protein
MEDN